MLDSIHEAKAYLQNPTASYPVTIRSFTYARREQLESATARAIRRFETLRHASTLTNNNPAYGNSLSVAIAKRLDMAYQMLEVLDARLLLAEMEENKMAFGEIEKELANLDARVTVLLDDSEKAVTELPAGFTSESERDASTINSFSY